MSTYKTQITLSNKTNYQLTLDEKRSSGLGGSWPSTIAVGEAVTPFDQGWDFQIKFSAWYKAEGTDGSEIEFSFYADEAQVFSQSISSDPEDEFSDSSSTNGGPMVAAFVAAGSAAVAQAS